MRNRSIQSVVILFSLVVLIGCESKKDKPAAESGNASNPNVNAFLQSGWDFRLGKNIAEIKANLGPPSSEKVEKIKVPPTPGQSEEIHRLSYDGLMVEVDKLTGSAARESLIRLVISNDKYKTKLGLKVGSPQEDVKRVLGEPWGVVRGALIYEEDIGGLTFYIQNSVVQKIQWEWYPE